jgi:hypothetical protein
MPLVAPTGTAITLVAATNVLPVNGSVEITAILIEAAGEGTPVHNGTLVSFTTTLGRIEPAEARTTAGKATVRLIADGRSGTARVRAFSGSAATPDAEALTVLIGAAAAARILVSASPQALPALGGSSTISARVEDAQGNGLLGVPVVFSTSAGTLSATSAVTNDQGVAMTTLTSNAAATVTARAGGGSSATGTTLEGTVALTLRTRVDVAITATPSSTSVSTPASFTVALTPTTAVADVLVDFGDGETLAIGTMSGSRTFVHLFGDSGILTVRATATDPDGVKTTGSTQIAVAPLAVTGSATPANVTAGVTQVVLSVAVTPTTAFISRYEWDFGEGGPIVSTQGSQINHVFAARGTKIVTVRVIPTRGDAITVLISVQVN